VTDIREVEVINVEHSAETGADLRLDGKVVIVTGGASGIGRSVCQRARSLGAEVACIDIAPAEDGFGVRCDVSDPAQVDSAAAAILERFGHIDALVNNAGIARYSPIAELSLEHWQRTLSINLTGAFLCLRSALPSLLASRGSIVNLSSRAGRQGSDVASAAYAASKAGLIGLTRHLARELGPQGMRVNAVLPGSVETPFFQSLASDQQQQRAVAATPLRRLATADDVGNVVCFLLAPAASYMNGALVEVDGGAS
jgi:NAD(P)-dependent dehydrogenase (short-subunit alcohol dehydrogenase family)